MNLERIDRVRKNLVKLGLTQMVVTDPASICYLTGYKNEPMERFMALYLAVDDEPALIVNRLFPSPEGCVPNVVTLWDTDDPIVVLQRLCIHDAPLGIDRTMEARWLLPLMDSQAASAYRLSSAAIDDARARKAVNEQQLMREASARNDEGMAWLKAQLRPGVTERQIADALEAQYQLLGADGNSFEPIVSFGANAADPHHEPDDTVLEAGQCALFDVGCKVKGYCADMTRTFFVGEPDEEFQKVYNLVLEANLAAERTVAPGVSFADIDAAARDVIERGGYGQYFTHRLGHFIGTEVHEPGDVSSANSAVAQEGMCFSIEPGIYLPGKFGVRIEDLVLVTGDSCEVLNHFPKELDALEA